MPRVDALAGGDGNVDVLGDLLQRADVERIGGLFDPGDIELLEPATEPDRLALVRPPLRSSMSSTSAPTAERRASIFAKARFANSRSTLRALTWRRPFSVGHGERIALQGAVAVAQRPLAASASSAGVRAAPYQPLA